MAKPLGNSVVVKEPWIEVRSSTETVGVRKVIPTKAVAGEITRSLASVKRSVEELGRICKHSVVLLQKALADLSDENRGSVPPVAESVALCRYALAPRSLGRPFFRFHSINMGVTYDIEIGYLLVGDLPNTVGLLLGKIPQGTYACLRYLGKNCGYQGNKALIDWIRASGYEMDNWDTELGDTFACRYEVYLSDIEREPDNKQWLKELAIKLRD